MQPLNVRCPWCNETFDLEVDLAAVEGEFCEECPMCGFPVNLRVVRDAAGRAVGIEVREDEEA